MDMITSSYIKENKTTTHGFKGFFNCGRCKGCSEVGHLLKKLIKTFKGKGRKQYRISDYITCNTKNVIECPCGLKYVGRTQRILKTRIREHCGNIRLGLPIHSPFR